MKKYIIVLLAIFYAIPTLTQTMEWHIKDDYVDIKYIGHDLFKVMNSNGKWGVINEYGETTVDIQYDSITSFVENRALLLDITGQFLKGIINEDGRIVKSFNNKEILANFQYFSEGMLAYGVVAGKYYQFGYLDLNGNTRIQPRFFWAAPFNKGKAVVQHKSKNYGLIDKSGGTVLNDNRKFKFMSTPVNNKLLIAVSSNRGEKVALANLEPTGKLSEIEELEGGTIVRNSSDYMSISCQNGHSYYFDNAMRLISSSTGRKFNAALTYDNAFSASTDFKKVRESGGWKIQYAGKYLLNSPFRDVELVENEYAIVTSSKNSKGVLRLNSNGSISIQGVPSKVEFIHNAKVTGNIAVDISGLFPSSRVQIGVVGLMENDKEEIYDLPVDYSGIYNQPISYFIPANSFDSEVNLPITINLYIDGMLHKTETENLTGSHKRAFKVSDAIVPDFSDSEGNAIISFSVQSLDGAPSSSAKVSVSGAVNQTKRFNGEETLHFRIPVTIPVDSEETFSFKVAIKEDGCPSYTRNISCVIKHYGLQ